MTDTYKQRYFKHNPKNKEKDIYKAGGLKKQYFSFVQKKINENPYFRPDDKYYVIRIAKGLMLNLEETEFFLHCSGYTFSDRNKKDKVIKELLQQGVHNINIWDERIREVSEKALSQIFFPAKVLDVFKRDASCEGVAREVLLDNAGVYEDENEAVSIYLFCCNLDPTTFSTGTFFHARFTRSFTEAIKAFVSRADTKVLLQLRKELRKMDLTFFLSHKMMKDYFEKYCPILNSILSKWKLVRELEEVTRDGRL